MKEQSVVRKKKCSQRTSLVQEQGMVQDQVWSEGGCDQEPKKPESW